MRRAPVRFSITSTFGEAADLAERVGRLCAALPGGDGAAADALRLALAEALNNIVAHAYAGAPGRPITAEFRPTRDGCEVLLTDEGLPMPGGRVPGAAAGFDADDLAALPEGGFGWPLILSQMDAVAYRRRGGRNLLRLARRFGAGR